MATEYKQNDVKDFAAHLKTLGAYVQPPIPQIVGLSNYQVIGSQDAKSLYPTIMVLLNIGYDTLRGRIYEWKIVGPVFGMMQRIMEIKKDDPESLEIGLSNFKGAISAMAKSYCARNKEDKKAEFISFTTEFYGECFRKIINFSGTFESILNPTTDEEYYLLKSAMYPLFEALTWISSHNRGYSTTVVDYVFYNHKFQEKYKDEQFLVFHEINSSKTHVAIFDYNQFVENIATKYVLNPYGTYFDTHTGNKSFEVDLILGGMDDRGFVKNQMLILNAISQNWGKLNIIQQKAFLLDHQKLDETIAREVVELVGDSNAKTREWQLKNLMSITFDTLVTEEKIVERLKLGSTQRESKSNGIKVTLNSGYGIYGMATWIYGNNLIANSITTGGKIYGIKLFQQIASNRLRDERQAIKTGTWFGKE